MYVENIGQLMMTTAFIGWSIIALVAAAIEARD